MDDIPNADLLLPEQMQPATLRVYDALVAANMHPRISRFPSGTRTAQDAAAAIGTTVAQIVKSLVFLADGAAVLVLVSGENMVDPVVLGEQVGNRTITRADAGGVREATGFAIGGVPPVATGLPVYIDRDLLQYPLVWAAAGTPNTVFPCLPHDLIRISGGTVVVVHRTG